MKVMSVLTYCRKQSKRRVQAYYIKFVLQFTTELVSSFSSPIIMERHQKLNATQRAQLYDFICTRLSPSSQINHTNAGDWSKPSVVKAGLLYYLANKKLFDHKNWSRFFPKLFCVILNNFFNFSSLVEHNSHVSSRQLHYRCTGNTAHDWRICKINVMTMSRS